VTFLKLCEEILYQLLMNQCNIPILHQLTLLTDVEKTEKIKIQNLV